MDFIVLSKEKTIWFKSYMPNKEIKVYIKNILWSTLGSLLFLLYINATPQSVDGELVLYADDTCLIFQHKDITEIERSLSKNFSMLCDWFVGNKLSIHFGEGKTKAANIESRGENH